MEGKVNAARFARERRIPFFGVCYGMQWAVVEFARHVCGLEGANTTEVDPQTPHPVIDLLPEQKAVRDKGGTMRLGLYPCRLTPGSLAGNAYGVPDVEERHRHRFEVNNDYLPILTSHGMRVTGLYPGRQLVEIIELTDHPWFVGTQFTGNTGRARTVPIRSTASSSPQPSVRRSIPPRTSHRSHLRPRRTGERGKEGTPWPRLST